MELSILLERDQRIEDPVLDRLEAFTGLSFTECRRKYYREAIALIRYIVDPQSVDRMVVEETQYERLSREQTVAHWQCVLDDYTETLRRLEA